MNPSQMRIAHKRSNIRTFQESSDQKFRISIPEEKIKTNSNWIHLNFFQNNVESKFVLHQFLSLPVRIEASYWKITFDVKKSTSIRTNRGYSKFNDWWILFQPIDMEEKQNSMRSDWVRLLDEIFCDQNIFSRRSKLLLLHSQALHTRNWKGIFMRKFFVPVRIGVLKKLHRMSDNNFWKLNKFKNQKKSQSA